MTLVSVVVSHLVFGLTNFYSFQDLAYSVLIKLDGFDEPNTIR